MACPVLGLEALQPLQPEPPPEPAFSEAQKWIEIGGRFPMASVTHGCLSAESEYALLEDDSEGCPQRTLFMVVSFGNVARNLQ
ncbi:hypothetical protein G4228_011512 [Cervus hanglu yarkandensis]|nr:hypothetical protein G4228_011512 [Cervus hanglu yarkandensis]